MTFDNFYSAFDEFLSRINTSINPAICQERESGKMSVENSPHDVNRGTHIILLEANNLLESERKAIANGNGSLVLDVGYSIAAFHIICYSANKQEEKRLKALL